MSSASRLHTGPFFVSYLRKWFTSTILDKILLTNSWNLVKQGYLWNVFEVIFWNFLAQLSKLSLPVACWTFASISKYFRDLCEIAQFQLITVWLLKRKPLIHSLVIIISFTLWWKKTVPKHEKFSKYFLQDCNNQIILNVPLNRRY